MPNPYATAEPAAALWYEEVEHASVFLGAIAYGLHATVFFMCLVALLRRRTNHYQKWLAFIFLLFALGTVNLSINIHESQLAWIDNRNFPGGPFAYITSQGGNNLLVAGNAESILISVLADGLLIYRVHVLYRRWWILVLPVLTWLASFACGILTTVQSAGTGTGLFKAGALNFGIPYFSLSMALNILLTILLISRLLYMKFVLQRTLGESYGRLYTTIAVMLVDSALPYGIVSLIFIVLYGTGNTASVLFLPLLVQIECISPIVIILRVTRGEAWSKETIDPDNLTSMRFQAQNHQAGTGSTVLGDRPQEMSMITFKPGAGKQHDQEQGSLEAEAGV